MRVFILLICKFLFILLGPSVTDCRTNLHQNFAIALNSMTSVRDSIGLFSLSKSIGTLLNYMLSVFTNALSSG